MPGPLIVLITLAISVPLTVAIMSALMLSGQISREEEKNQ